jgi:prepilin-type N-terminal cleavage/methylation domain-containing protein
MKNYLKTYLKIYNVHSSSAGFTLIELLVAMALTTIVVTAAGFGLITIMDNNKKAEAKTERRIELSRALDFMMDEIRMARRINTTTNTTTTASAAVTASNTATAFSPSLGSTGTIVLYLEIPLSPTTCSGSPGPTFDRVVYDIRSSTSTWLSPRTINRYGRIPGNNGTIDPCSNPVASEALVDSISDTNINPTCTSDAAVKSGAEGFYACVNGRLVDLYLRSKVTSTENYDLSGKGFSRIAP